MSMVNVNAKMVGMDPTAVNECAMIINSVKTARKPVIAKKITQKCAIPGQETVYASPAGLVNNVIVLVRCSNMVINASTPVIVIRELSVPPLMVNAFVCQGSSGRNVSYHVLKESTDKIVENHADVKTTLHVMVKLVNVYASLAGKTTSVTVHVTRTPTEKTVLNHASVIIMLHVIQKMEYAHVQLDGLDSFAIENVSRATMVMDVS